jgi:hypothetical protein
VLIVVFNRFGYENGQPRKFDIKLKVPGNILDLGTFQSVKEGTKEEIVMDDTGKEDDQ